MQSVFVNCASSGIGAGIVSKLLPLLLVGLLFGCSGGDTSESAQAVEVQTSASQQEVGSSGATIADAPAPNPLPSNSGSSAEPVDVDDEQSGDGVPGASATISASQRQAGYYWRDVEYPAMVTLPLQFITAADGKKMAALVSLPADEHGNPIDGKFPVVLVQAGYNMHWMATLAAIPGLSLLGTPDKFIVQRGYAQVSVDVVGTGVSQGGWEMLGEEEQAGYSDAVDWVLQQPWSNGNIGVAGVSYMAITALFTAERRPDAIKAVFAMLPIGDAMRGTVGTGGLINALFVNVWAKLTHTLSLQNQIPMLKYPELRDYFSAVNDEHVGQVDGFFIPLIDDALNGVPYITYDSEFWRTRSTLDHVDQIRAPTFITGALHDLFQRDEPQLYEQLRKNVDTRLVIYDGDHATNLIQEITGGDEVDPILSLYLRWFDHYLKGIDTGVEDIPAVTQYVKNYGQIKKSKGLWRGFATTTDWPHPQVAAERWYLRGDMTINKQPPAQTEATHSVAMAEEYELTWGKSPNGKYLEADLILHDGTDCSISYRQWTLGVAGILDQRSCMDENSAVEANALNFESDPMQENYYINGPVQADIWIESSATDAVLSVRLDEVSPDGAVNPISNGLLLASNRAVDEGRSRYIDGEMIQPFHYLTEERVLPVVPGDVIRMPVEIFPTSVIILKGHKLRISVAASNQAQGILNRPRQAQMAGAVITVHNSPQHLSSIVLPVVPLSALN